MDMNQIATKIEIGMKRFKSIRKDIQTVSAAARKRVEKEKGIDAARIEELQDIANNNDILKPISESEIAEIKSKRYSATEAEIAAVTQLEKEGRILIDEIRKNISLFSDAKAEYIKKADEKSESINRIEISLLPKWLDGDIYDFDSIK